MSHFQDQPPTDEEQDRPGVDTGADDAGEVSEGGLEGSAPASGADAVPAEHTTPGDDDADV